MQAALDFVGRRITGRYDIDAFGFDQDLVEHVLAPLAWLVHRRWFRATWKGLEHVPSSGPALLVGNHAGTIPIDALVLRFGLSSSTPPTGTCGCSPPTWRSAAVVVALARKLGTTLACAEDAHRLLRAGELVGRVAGGLKGVGKPFSERYRLQRFGRGGFVATRCGPARRSFRPDRGVGGDLSDDRQREAAGPALRLPVLPDHADVPVARPVGAGARSRRSGSSSSASRSPPTATRAGRVAGRRC